MNLTILLDVLKLAGIYIAMGLGFVVIYRASRVLNLAQPGMIMLGAFLALTLLPRSDGFGNDASIHFWLIVIILIAGGGVLGFTSYVLLIRPLAGSPRISIVLMTLAALFLTEALVDIFWPGQLGFLRLPGNSTAYELIGTRLRLFDLIPIVVGFAMWAAVAGFYRWSRLGIRIRAVAENAALAARRGININLVGAVSWGLAGAIAVVASLLVGTQGMVSSLVVATALKGFSVALVGGLDSVAGLFPAAVLVAASEVLTVRFVDQQLGEAVPFIVLMVVLLIKPWGIAGTVEELDRV